jgi:hypothetical protein
MKNIKQDYDDLRPEYSRADFAGSVRGKYAYVEFEFAQYARALLYCVADDEGLTFTNHSKDDDRARRRRGDWTCEIDDANQITLRYWLSASANIEEPMSNPSSISNPQLREELQTLLTTHIRALKTKVAANSKR